MRAHILSVALMGLIAPLVVGQTTRPAPAPRLPATQLDVRPPSARVSGEPGSMRVTGTTCRASVPLTPALRQRIVDIAVQEWAFFGYTVVDQTVGESDDGQIGSIVDLLRARRWSVTSGWPRT